MHQSLRVFFSVSMLAALAACGGGSSTPTSTTVSGVASKGPLSGSTICAYAVNADGTKGSKVGNCVTSSSTGVVGSYSLDLGSYAGAVLIEATGGSYTDEATGTTTTLAAPLRSALSSVTAGVNSAALTALTEVAVQLAEASTGKLTAANIQSAVKNVQTNFGVADIITIQPVDALNVPATAATTQKAYALALATVSQYIKNNSATLASALQTMQGCLATASTCGTLATTLNTALSNFQAAHSSGFTGISMSVGSFGTVTSGSTTGGSSTGGTTGGTTTGGSTTAGSVCVASVVVAGQKVGDVCYTNLPTGFNCSAVGAGSTLNGYAGASVTFTTPVSCPASRLLTFDMTALAGGSGSSTGGTTGGTTTGGSTSGTGTSTGATGAASNGTPNVAVANCSKRIPTGDLVFYTGCSAGAVANFTNITVKDTLSGSGKTCTASYANGVLTATDGTLTGSQPMDGTANASINTYATNNVDSTLSMMQASTIVGTTAPIVRVSWNAAGKPFAIQFGSTSVGGGNQVVNCMTSP